MSADSLYDNIRSYLKLTYRVVSQTGNDINEGERFTIRFTGSNAAYQANLVDRPVIVFRDAEIYVRGTVAARPVNGSGWHKLPDSLLFPGESSFVDVEFQALKNAYWGIDRVAEAFIRGDLDQDRFFRLWNFLPAEAWVWGT